MKSDQNILCEDLLLLMRCVKHGLFTLAESRGLTQVQLFALHSIETHGHLAMGQMASAMFCDASNVTGIIDRLVAQGLVLRKESERDRRTKMLELTDKGKETIESIKAALPAQLGCGMLSDQEQKDFHTIIRKICSQMV